MIPYVLHSCYIENIMEIMKFAVCLILMTSCFAAEDKTTELTQQLKVQKREKQYLIEDDPFEGPEQKRDERQSTPAKNDHIEPKVTLNTIKVRLQPKVLSAPIKQTLKPGVLQKPSNVRIDTTPQRIPTKIPVILKTAKVVPGPAHALRLKMLESKINESISNLDKENTLSSNTVDSPILYKDNIPYIIEDKTTPKTESRSSPPIVDEVISNHESNVTLNRDGKEILAQDKKVSIKKDSQDTINDNEQKFLNHDNQETLDRDRKTTFRINKQKSESSSDIVQKPVKFFVDEPEPLPLSRRNQHNIELKEIPIVKMLNSKPKKDEPKQKDPDDQTDNDPDITRISNGTHLISIKKIRNNDRYKIERLVSRDGDEDTPQTEERIVNFSIKPPKPKPTADKPEKHPASFTDNKENEDLPRPVFGDKKKKEEKGQDDCITITNHNYEEFEEKTPILSPVTIQPTNIQTRYNDGSQESWNYLLNPYYNPYHHNIYDQYRRSYGLAQSTPKMYGQEINNPKSYGVSQSNSNINSQENIDPYPYNPDNTQIYYPNDNPPTYIDSYQDPTYETQPEIDYTFCPELLPEVSSENNLDRIWKAWKDIEIKIRKAHINNEPINIDIRRNLVEKSEGNKDDVIGKVESFATSVPIAFNGYLNNQNSALIYPYVNPNYRYIR